MEIRKQDSVRQERNNPKSPIAVACLVLVDLEGSVLITQRPNEKQLGGLWEFPGGKVEAGESSRAALRRELSEELQLKVGLLHPLLPVIHVYEFGVIELIPFLSQCEQRPAVHLVEHSDFTWVASADLASYEWAPADLPVVEELMAILDGNEIQLGQLPKT
jgi:mutator protein MutT